MAITVECPRCTHKQKIDDDRAGKETPCKICHHMIQPAGAKAKPSAKTSLAGAAAGASKTKLSKDGIQAGKPSPTKTAADKNTKALPPKVNEKKKKTSDDDDEEDDRPKRKRKPDKKSDEGGSYMPLYIIGGMRSRRRGTPR